MNLKSGGRCRRPAETRHMDLIGLQEMQSQEILIKNLGYLQFICNLTLNLKVI